MPCEDRSVALGALAHEYLQLVSLLRQNRQAGTNLPQTAADIVDAAFGVLTHVAGGGRPSSTAQSTRIQPHGSRRI